MDFRAVLQASMSGLARIWLEFRHISGSSPGSRCKTGVGYFFRYYDVVVLEAIIWSDESLRCGFMGFMGQLHSLIYRNDHSEQNWVQCESSGLDVPNAPTEGVKRQE